MEGGELEKYALLTVFSSKDIFIEFFLDFILLVKVHAYSYHVLISTHEGISILRVSNYQTCNSL